jgi:hypothetical protein
MGMAIIANIFLRLLHHNHFNISAQSRNLPNSLSPHFLFAPRPAAFLALHDMLINLLFRMS